MVLLVYTTLVSVDLAQYETFRAEVCNFWQGGINRYKGKGVSRPGNLRVSVLLEAYGINVWLYELQ